MRSPHALVSWLAIVLSVALAPEMAPAQVVFDDISLSSGIGPYTRPGSQGAGVAAADFDEDGDIDLFVPNGSGAPNQLYRNLGNGSFEEIAAAAGLDDLASTRVGLFFDYDGDGRLDLLTVGDCIGASPTLCASFRTTILYRQTSDAIFEDVTVEAGLEGAIPAANDRHAGGAAAGDVNGDGFLDLFLTDWSADSSTNADGSRLYLNDGTGGFVDSTSAAGLVVGQDKRWQPVIVDLDGDGAVDIYSAVDFSANRMWINQGGGSFLDLAPAAGTNNAWNDTGVAIGDPDNDGDLDVYVTNVEDATPTTWSVLYENLGAATNFSEIAQTSGIDDGSWGWGATWLDADNDGWLDLAHTNGSFLAPYSTDASRFYHNDGTIPLGFTDISVSSGFDDTDWGSGLISFDADRDGDLDLFQVTNDSSAAARLFENVPDVATNHYLVVKPRMFGANHWAIGAVVRISAGGVDMMRPILAGTSFLSQEPAEAHFGIGTATQADTVTIEWPDGTTSQLTNVAADQVVTVTPQLFSDQTVSQGVEFLHVFQAQHPPFAAGGAWGDFDGDGDPDLFVANREGPNKLFENQGGGSGFVDVAVAAGVDVPADGGDGGIWGDYDNDGDQDLYILNLGDNRLFRNDGGGVFTDVTTAAGVACGGRTVSAAWGDYDNDGFNDLYVANHEFLSIVAPDQPEREDCLFHSEDDGMGGRTFTDVAPDTMGLPVLSYRLAHSAGFVDIDNDGDLDIYVVNEDYSHKDPGIDGANQMWRNDGACNPIDVGCNPAGWLFVDVAGATNLDWQGAPMGVAIADYNNDGWLDLFTSDYGANHLYHNNGNSTFTDRNNVAGIAREYIPGTMPPQWQIGWGLLLSDFDMDGDEDLYVATAGLNSSAPDQPNPTFLNNGDAPLNTFTEVTEGIASDAANPTERTHGVVKADYDGDGDEDLYVVNWQAQGHLFRNQTVGANYIKLRLVGTTSNRDAIGARVVLSVAGLPAQHRMVQSGSTAGGSHDHTLVFGTPGVRTVDSVTIDWPSGASATYFNLPVRQTHTIVEGSVAGDTDGDGLMDADEALLGTNPLLTDSDGDGIPDGIEVGNPLSPIDTDSDLTIDALDTDDDGDGVATILEDANGNGDPRDDDADGDGIPDYLETDADDDGELDGTDNCRSVPNPLQSDVNSDGIGDLCQPADRDHDGWPDVEDNCPDDVNVDQLDTSMNGIGDVCDGRSMARIWNEQLLHAIRKDLARPTVHARNLYHVSAAMWDAWAAYDPTRPGIFHDEVATAADVPAARDEAIAYAAYRLLVHRFTNSVGAGISLPRFDARMGELGYDINATTTVGPSPAAVGNRVAETIIAMGATDGANEANNYVNQHYLPVNTPLFPTLPGNPDIADPNRWQPLALQFFIDQSGNPIPGGFPQFLGPEWGQVTPFALTSEDLTIYNRDGFDYWVYHDPGPPPKLGGVGDDYYKFGAEMVVAWSGHLDPTDGVMWDISPGGIGNTPIPDPNDYATYYDFENGGDIGPGHTLNPITGQPYTPQIVARGDYARVLAEFWADGPDSETPPGHWFAIANYVSDHPQFAKQMGGTGAVLEDLEWDVKLYLMLGGAMHDVAVTAWGVKGWYDYIRPISAIRLLAANGQSSDPGGPSYHPDGIGLHPGVIEVVTAESSGVGERHEHLAADIGKIAIRAWRGPDYINDPDTDDAGVGWILAENWWPYQRPSFVTPPFAGFVSGHSTFSRAASELMTIVTGTPYFPGGLGEFPAPQNEFLVFEEGPSQTITLQWATYHDASDQTSLSRIWGGIHPPADDLPGRLMGRDISHDVIAKAQAIFGESVCSDLIDNDEDGLSDLDDPGCRDAFDMTETLDDRDGDGIDDEVESGLGTDPDLADSDADGVPDGIEVGDIQAPTDSDGDLLIDALDPDDDGDGWATIEEDANGNNDWTDDDTDADGIPNYLDWDSDNDGFSDGDEIGAGSDPLDPLSAPAAPPVPTLGPWSLVMLFGLLVTIGIGVSGWRRRGIG